METDNIAATPGKREEETAAPEHPEEPPSPRTQEARRAATIAKLTDAAIETIVEFGYARASTNEICKRARVSQGALFRHFPTRGDFMAHVAEAVFARQIADFETNYLRDDSLPNDPLERAIRFTRVVCQSRLGRTWTELVVASRTDEQLQEKVSEVFHKARKWAREAARKVFSPEAVHDEERFNAVVETVLWMFEMEGIYAHLDNDEQAAERRLQVAIQCYRQYFNDQE